MKMSKPMLEVPEQLAVIKRGAIGIFSEKELTERLEQSQRQCKPLNVKLGVDPTSPDIHLGHTVVLRKLRQFQDLGHQAILIIGDFTALVGDPSGRDKTRPQLTSAEIEKNARTYLDQVGKILNLKTLQIVRNSEWLKKLRLNDILKLAGQVTVARLIERDDFAQRLKAQTPIGLHELLYPLMQAYDSVAIKSDIELGGTDQTFNLLFGRELQRAEGQTPQIAITTPLLVGLDGVDKMSKTLNNHIGVTEPPFEMFSKTMSIPDKLMKEYYTRLTNVDTAEIDRILSSATHPKEAKVRLGQEIVKQFYDEPAARESAARFSKVFSRKEIPEDIPAITINQKHLKPGNRIWLPKLLNLCKMASSNSAAKRLIQQGGLVINNQKVIDADQEIEIQDGLVLKVGKKNRFCRIKLT